MKQIQEYIRPGDTSLLAAYERMTAEIRAMGPADRAADARKAQFEMNAVMRGRPNRAAV